MTAEVRPVTDRAILLQDIALRLRTFGLVLRQDMQWVAVAEEVVLGVVVVVRGVAVAEVPWVQVSLAQVAANKINPKKHKNKINPKKF